MIPKGARTVSKKSLRLQFTLRILLAVLTVACVWFAVEADRNRRQSNAVEALEEVKCTILYGHEYTPPSTSTRFMSERIARPAEWSLLGRELSHRAVVVIVDPERVRAALPHLKKLRYLKEVSIYAPSCISGRNSSDEQKQKAEMIRELPSIQVTHFSLGVVG